MIDTSLSQILTSILPIRLKNCLIAANIPVSASVLTSDSLAIDLSTVLFSRKRSDCLISFSLMYGIMLVTSST